MSATKLVFATSHYCSLSWGRNRFLSFCLAILPVLLFGCDRFDDTRLKSWRNLPLPTISKLSEIGISQACGQIRRFRLFPRQRWTYTVPTTTKKPVAPTPAPNVPQPAPATAWKSLFDGKTLSGWEVTDFGGQGDVEVKDGAIVLEMGSEMTGVTWKRDFPRVNYEVSLESKRITGNDFFCGVVFPVEKKPCSLVLGGWGGSVVGLSSIDGQYAVENETTQIMGFDTDKWYRVRLRVTTEKIEVWIDDKQVVDLKTAGHEVSVHPSVEIMQPFGLCCYATKAAMRDVRWRPVEATKEEKKK